MGMAPTFSGKVNGKSANFSWTDDNLEWEDLKSREKSSVTADSIVTCIPELHDGDESGGFLLFVKHDETSGAKIKLQSLQLSYLPRSVWMKYEFSCPRHLRAPSDSSTTPPAIHVIISTLSGTQKAASFFNDVLKPLLSFINITTYDVHETQSADTILELAETVFLPNAQAGVRLTIILLSGDGGLIDLIRVFSENYEDAATLVVPVVSLIPMGTGNATANSTGLLSDSTYGLSTLLRGHTQTLPTFRVRLPPGSMYMADEGRKRKPVSAIESKPGIYKTEMYGAVVVSWGMHASLVADSDTTEYRKFGADRFKMAAKELLYPSDGTESHEYKGNVVLVEKDSTTGQEKERLIDRTTHMYVLTTLMSQLEKGFTVSPSSKPLDGQLRIIHFGPLLPDEAMNLMNMAYQGGKHVNETSVGYDAVEAVRIEFEEEEERWRRICIDGKIISVPQGGWLEVRKSRKNFIELVTA